MAPSYTLYYFQGRGRGEILRLIFAAADIKYQDVRFSKEEWAKKKPEFESGKLPCVEIDGKKWPQTMSIARHLSAKYGLMGKSEEEALQIDVIVETVTDLMMRFYMMAYMLKDEAHKAEMKKEIMEKEMPATIKLLDQWCGKGFLVGDKLSLADLVFFDSFSTMKEQGIVSEACAGQSEKLKAVFGSVKANKGVAEWLKNRPAV